MEITKFDLTIHDIDRITDLILRADSEIGKAGHTKNSYKTVKGLIKAGNNFLGYENIYLCTEDQVIQGIMIAYSGKGGSELTTLLKLLVSLRLSELASYITLTANILHGGYTPDIEEDDFYVSALVVDKCSRRKGIGSLLLSKALEMATERKCKRILLDVDRENETARSLYTKFGFKSCERNSSSNSNYQPPEICTMELILS